jgi:hypothetical protein
MADSNITIIDRVCSSGDDRYDQIARELFHEQIPQIGIYRIQRKLEVHNSLLNVVLHDKPEIKRGMKRLVRNKFCRS